MENTGPESFQELWRKFLEIIDRQLEQYNRLRDLVSPIADEPAAGKGATLNEATAEQIRTIFVDIEALLGEGRAIFHGLFEDEE